MVAMKPQRESQVIVFSLCPRHLESPVIILSVLFSQPSKAGITNWFFVTIIAHKLMMQLYGGKNIATIKQTTATQCIQQICIWPSWPRCTSNSIHSVNFQLTFNLSDSEHVNKENSAKTGLEVYQIFPTIRLRSQVTDIMGTKPTPFLGQAPFLRLPAFWWITETFNYYEKMEF